MVFSVKWWLRISLLNLLLVAILGVTMRYKIAFSFPYLEQKHLQHAHSHFAFDGWITQTLFILLTTFLVKFLKGSIVGKYKYLLIVNLVCAYGMLLSFIAQGYGLVSISFSTLSIFTGYLFSFWYYHDLKTVPMHPAKNWFNAALLFNLLSSLGTFSLAYMMYTKSIQQDYYLGSLYFYLHFQYNGWFFFACMGLLISWLMEKYPTLQIKKSVFRLFFWACIPAYFLSTLWAKLPGWLYTIVVLAAIAQVAAWLIFVVAVRKDPGVLKKAAFSTTSLIFVLVAIAFSIKLLLQLGSTIPFVSKLAFGFRPIVIAYLHLILLAVFTLFLLGYLHAQDFFNKNSLATRSLWIIATGIFINEFILLVQGVAGFSYTPVPYANEALLGAALILLFGIAMLLRSQLKKIKS